jgi:hypothetical protein
MPLPYRYKPFPKNYSLPLSLNFKAFNSCTWNGVVNKTKSESTAVPLRHYYCLLLPLFKAWLCEYCDVKRRMRILNRNCQLSLVFRTIYYEYMSHPLNTEITPAINIPTSHRTHQDQRVIAVHVNNGSLFAESRNIFKDNVIKVWSFQTLRDFFK